MAEGQQGRRRGPTGEPWGSPVRETWVPPCEKHGFPRACLDSLRSVAEDTKRNVGKVIEIKGVVLDAVFPNRLPEIYHALQIQMPSQDGGAPSVLVAEVQQHLGDDRVRAVAMDSTDGLAR